ncbi:hypothetical protein M878_23865 [Streptomyces roseochromogenus subsp. oscitans DS 12.976]|uniref:Uncharacterized protein n=2 Tax=Streptomyces roseochromogenus TaxID=285450 RepID=V6K701_STRRC|nr:hypothetical protein M878_23865 [Streptomyces roseochromogenus subsp. oscitans DS 12.976]
MEMKEMTVDERPARSAEEAVERVRAALYDVGIVLPSLRIDPVTGAHGHPYALVDLGRCNIGVASKLAAVLRAKGCPPDSAETPTDEALRERVRRLNRESVRGVT